MHGDLLCSYYKCKYVEFNTTSPICNALSGIENLNEKSVSDPEIDVKLQPRCSQCRRLFEEMPHHMDAIDELEALLQRFVLLVSLTYFASPVYEFIFSFFSR